MGHAHRKTLQRCCCRDLKVIFQVPSSVSLLCPLWPLFRGHSALWSPRVPADILDIPSCALRPVIYFSPFSSHHGSVSLCISYELHTHGHYASNYYMHMFMRILLWVSLKVGLYTCPALQGVPFGRNISERTRMECVTIKVSAL